MKVTPDVFEASLKCPTKCWLRATGEASAGNGYAEWVKAQNDSYRTTATERLIAEFATNEVARSPAMESVMAAKWRLASSLALQAQTDCCVVESALHAIERVPAEDQGKPAELIPIRFVFTNKIGNVDKLLLGFDVLALSTLLGCEIDTGKIIHGDDRATLRTRTSALTGEVGRRIGKVAALLSNASPPELVLNRHCTECEFRDRCRQKAKETDDLSLLSGMSEKERARHRNKGIFTVTQLSHTFRPRRTPKRAKNPAKPHHFSLQALAIRENCVYIHGSPVLPECKSKVYLDIEGLPDRDFHYLIGALIVTEERETFHSFWADTESDEATIFLQLAEAISQLPDFRVFHYGDYDAAAMKRVATGLPAGAQEQFDAILNRSVNVLSLIYPHVYFPTFSNSLKDIIPHLGRTFGNQGPTGLDSIVWRMQWEQARDTRLRKQLLEYNHSDCTALKQLTDFVTRRISNETETREDEITVSRTEDMKLARPRWQLFERKPHALSEFKEVIKSAYFDYQREKVFIRTHRQFKSINQRATKKKSNFPSKPDRTILVEAERCPHCRSRKLNRSSESSYIVADLKFSRSGVRKYVTQFVSWRYCCEKCGIRFRSEERPPNPQRIGHGLVSWCVYQNNVLGVNILKVRKSLVDLFGLHLEPMHLYRAKGRIASFYEPLYAELLSGILTSSVLHIDETTVKLRKLRGYVWVFTTLDRVYYLYRPTREAEFLRDLLGSFRGVLVTDFYTGYDSLPCEQQKCLVHLVRDIDDDLLRNPFDEELKRLAQAFGSLLRSIVSTIDRFGLRRRHLKKHKSKVERFMEREVTIDFTSELANKYGKRIKKYGSRMFAFLDHDGVPWNNNNAEHAIKRFAKYRRDTDGLFSERTLKDYLVLASVFETCEFNSVNVLEFLLSKEQTVDGLLRMGGRKKASSSKPSEAENAQASD
jgi:predicted RecB family nuclease